MGNELLNEIKGINLGSNPQTGGILLEQGRRILSNLDMKFPDLSNIEEDKVDKIIGINNNNEFDRSKAIDDIKKNIILKKVILNIIIILIMIIMI